MASSKAKKENLEEVHVPIKTIAITIHNETTFLMKNASVYFLCGTSDEFISERLEPEPIQEYESVQENGSVQEHGLIQATVSVQEKKETKHSTTYNARKTSGPVPSGVVGVIGYQIEFDSNNPDETLTVAIYFRVPFYRFKKNRWNVMLVEETMVNKNTYRKLLNNSINADGSWFEKCCLHYPRPDFIPASVPENLQFTFSGSMSTSSNCELEVHIEQCQRRQ